MAVIGVRRDPCPSPSTSGDGHGSKCLARHLPKESYPRAQLTCECGRKPRRGNCVKSQGKGITSSRNEEHGDGGRLLDRGVGCHRDEPRQ